MDFEAYVAARGPALPELRVRPHPGRPAAEDLTQTALAQAYRHWSRVERAEHPDAYVRKVLVNAHLSWRRRRSSRSARRGGRHRLGCRPLDAVADRDQTRATPRPAAPRARAILVLRYYADLDDASIADLLSIRPSTVRATASAPWRRSGRPPYETPSRSPDERRLEQDLRELFAADAARAPVAHDLADALAAVLASGPGASAGSRFSLRRSGRRGHRRVRPVYARRRTTPAPDGEAARRRRPRPPTASPRDDAVVPEQPALHFHNVEVPVPAAMLDDPGSSAGAP